MSNFVLREKSQFYPIIDKLINESKDRLEVYQLIVYARKQLRPDRGHDK